MQNFQNSKIVQYVVKPYLEIWHAKFRVDISIFGKCIAKNPYSLMTSSIQASIQRIFKHCTEIKTTFLESSDQTGSETQTFYSKNQFENFTLCDPGLTRHFSVLNCMVSDCKMASFFVIIRAKVTINHVPHARKSTFDPGDLL